MVNQIRRDAEEKRKRVYAASLNSKNNSSQRQCSLCFALLYFLDDSENNEKERETPSFGY